MCLITAALPAMIYQVVVPMNIVKLWHNISAYSIVGLGNTKSN